MVTLPNLTKPHQTLPNLTKDRSWCQPSQALASGPAFEGVSGKYFEEQSSKNPRGEKVGLWAIVPRYTIHHNSCSQLGGGCA